MACGVPTSEDAPEGVGHCTKFARNLTNGLRGFVNQLVVQDLALWVVGS